MTATESPITNQHAFALAAKLRHNGCYGLDEWTEYQRRINEAWRVLREKPFALEDTLAGFYQEGGWSAAEAWKLAKEMCALPSVQIRLALEEEQRLAYDWVQDYQGERMSADELRVWADQDARERTRRL